jgi:hypothetical protein
MRHSYRCHLALDAIRDNSVSEANGERARLDPSDIVGDVRCPCCRAVLVARMGRRGPYFHCLCYEQKKSDICTPQAL